MLISPISPLLHRYKPTELRISIFSRNLLKYYFSGLSLPNYQLNIHLPVGKNELMVSSPVIGQLSPILVTHWLKPSNRSSLLAGSELDSSQFFEYSTTETDCQVV